MSQRVPAATKNVPELFAERVNEPLGRLVKTTLDTKGVERFCVKRGKCQSFDFDLLSLFLLLSAMIMFSLFYPELFLKIYIVLIF